MTITNLGLNLPAQGDPTVRNNWANAVCIPDYEILDSYTSSLLTKSVAGSSNVVLALGSGSVGDAQHTHFVFTGALTGNVVVLWPVGRSFKFTAKNNTTGAFTLSVGSDNGSGIAAGTTVALPASGILDLYNDGTNVSVIGVSLTPIANGTMLANESGGTAVPTAVSIPTLHSQLIGSTGTFTIPSNANSSTVFEFIVNGAGGGGGGSGPSQGGGGAGSGASLIVGIRGFTPGANVNVTIGAAGLPGVGSLGTNGGTGGTTSLTYSAITVVSCTGGQGGPVNMGAAATVDGRTGTASVNFGGSGLTLAYNYLGGAQPGIQHDVSGSFAKWSGCGGGNILGTGGHQLNLNETGNGVSGTNGAGGGGSLSDSSNSFNGGSGGSGVVVAKWVL